MMHQVNSESVSMESGDTSLEAVNAWWVNKKRSKDVAPEAQLRNISLKFITKQQQYAIPQTSISVKENSYPKDLNDILNSILEKGGMVENIPKFEFMIGSKLLTVTIGQHLQDLDMSFEVVAEVEYFERYPPPTPLDNLEHDDWVSSVMSCGVWLLTGCYDNTVQLWTVNDLEKGRGRKAHKLTIPAHKAPVKAVSWMKTKEEVKTFVSCSIDQKAFVWDWNSSTNSVECIWECRGHSQSIESLSVLKNSTKFATGSWDNTVKIWDGAPNTNLPIDREEPDSKKAKTDKHHRLKTPIMTFGGHSENVSGVDWINHKELLSCSWDHSIRLWNLEIGGMVSQISGNVSFFCISYSPLNKKFLVGCADKHVRLYDTRATDGCLVQNKFIGHTKWVSSVRWSPNDENVFVSGGYDRAAKVWDIRCSKSPLYHIRGHDEKILSVDWSIAKHIASGSADCSAHIYSV